jgi:hypothetical protein
MKINCSSNKQRGDVGGDILVVLFGLGLLFALALLGYCAGVKDAHDEAAKFGAGKYAVDNAGQVSFQYITATNK